MPSFCHYQEIASLLCQQIMEKMEIPCIQHWLCPDHLWWQQQKTRQKCHSCSSKWQLITPRHRPFSKHLGKHLDFGLFSGPPPLSHNMFDIPLLILKTQITHNFSIIHNQPSNITSSQNSHITPCSIVVCKLIGTIATDKVYCVLFCSSKTIIHKLVVPCTYTPIQSNDDLWIFPLQDPLSPPTLLPYTNFDSQNSTPILLSMNTLCLLLIPLIFAWQHLLTASLVLIS